MTEFYTNVNWWGKFIRYRGYDNGRQFQRRKEYRPTLYLPSKDETDFHTIHGEPLAPFQPGNIPESREFIKKYVGVDNFEFYGQTSWDVAFISDHYTGKVEYDPKLIRALWIDLEVASDDGFPEPDIAAKEITLIGTHYRGKYIIFGCRDYVPAETDTTYIKSSNERELLQKFISFWRRIMPDIVIGYNAEIFDYPYLIRRIRRVLDDAAANSLSPWDRIDERQFAGFNGKETTVFDICGVTLLDYLVLYKKFSGKPQEDYRLDTVAHSELGIKKLSYGEYGNLTQLYLKNFQRYTEYNRRDIELLVKMDHKNKLLELAYNLAYSAKVNYNDIFKQTRMWDSIIYNFLRDRNIIIPQKKQRTFHAQIAGGFVKEPTPGLYEWICNFDLDSLYPHLIMGYNIGPDTFKGKSSFDFEKIINENINENLDYLRENDVSITANGTMYDRKKPSFLTELMETLYAERKQYKNMAGEAKKILKTVEEEIKRRKL